MKEGRRVTVDKPHPLCVPQFSKLHLCVQQAGAVSRLANHTAGVPLEEMGREGSVVMTVDEVTLREEPERQKEWFGEVAASLARYIGHTPCVWSVGGVAVCYTSTHT